MYLYCSVDSKENSVDCYSGKSKETKQPRATLRSFGCYSCFENSGENNR
jgi:hypothetical protein